MDLFIEFRCCPWFLISEEAAQDAAHVQLAAQVDAKEESIALQAHQREGDARLVFRRGKNRALMFLEEEGCMA